MSRSLYGESSPEGPVPFRRRVSIYFSTSPTDGITQTKPQRRPLPARAKPLGVRTPPRGGKCELALFRRAGFGWRTIPASATVQWMMPIHVSMTTTTTITTIQPITPIIAADSATALSGSQLQLTNGRSEIRICDLPERGSPPEEAEGDRGKGPLLPPLRREAATCSEAAGAAGSLADRRSLGMGPVEFEPTYGGCKY